MADDYDWLAKEIDARYDAMLEGAVRKLSGMIFLLPVNQPTIHIWHGARMYRYSYVVIPARKP